MKRLFVAVAVLLLFPLRLPCRAQTKVLLVDYLVSDPIAFANVFRHFTPPEFELEYRRFYPGLAETDREFKVIILASSRHPYPSAEKMSLAEGGFLRGFVQNGGILVSLFSSEENDRVILNRLLKDLGLAVRIEGKAIYDPVNGYRSFLIPSAYFLNYPMLQVGHETPFGKGVDRIFGGKSFSLLAEPGPNLSIPVYSFETSLRMDGFLPAEKSGQKGREGIFLGGSYEVPVMAVARSGGGFVLLLPRYLTNMNGYTTRWSDKPSIPPGAMEENALFEANLMEYIKDLARGKDVFTPDFPLKRADRLEKWEDRAEKVVLEEGSLPRRAPLHCADRLSFDPQKRRSLNILHPVLKTLAEEKIRSVFFHLEKEFGRPESPGRIAAYLKSAGFNLVEGMLGISPYEGLKSEDARATYLENIRAIVRAMEANGIKMYLGSYFPYGAYYKKKAYSRLVSSSGVESGLPSPVDRTYWQDAFLPLAREIARLGREFPSTVIGMLWDLELYDFDTVAASEAYTFDTIAFEIFQKRKSALLERLNLAAEARLVPQSRRFSWLKDNGLLGEYYRALEEEMSSIASWIDGEVKKINPELLWGFYAPGIVQSWFYTGLFRALSTPDRPILLITYEGRGNQQVDYNAQKGIYLLHCPGLLLNTLKGEEWSQCLPELALREDGYWLYQGFQLFQDDGWVYGRNDFTFREGPADLRRSLADANRRLAALVEEHKR